MPTGFYLTHPGLDIMDNAHVHDAAGGALSYEALFQELGPAARTVVMNYPPELLKRGILDAQILSFSRHGGRTVLARVYLGCKDAMGRQIPVTEIFMGQELSWKAVLALNPIIPKELHRPPWPRGIGRSFGSHIVKTPSEVEDWNREWQEAFQEAASAFQGGRQGPWVSLCFDRVQFLPFDGGRLYPSKKKLTERRGLILAGVGILVILVIALLVSHRS